MAEYARGGIIPNSQGDSILGVVTDCSYVINAKVAATHCDLLKAINTQADSDG